MEVCPQCGEEGLYARLVFDEQGFERLCWDCAVCGYAADDDPDDERGAAAPVPEGVG